MATPSSLSEERLNQADIDAKPGATLSNKESESSGPVCRICHESNSKESFLSPCRCKGTLSVVHQTCLERWLAESDTSFCELCGYSYATVREPRCCRYRILPSFFMWLCSEESRAEVNELFVDFFALSAFAPLAIMSSYYGFMSTANVRNQDYLLDTSTNTIQFTNGSFLATVSLMTLTMTIDAAFASWLIVRLHHHFMQWHSWWRRNCSVRLIRDKRPSSDAISQTVNKQ